jgi:hypothetical protein
LGKFDPEREREPFSISLSPLFVTITKKKKKKKLGQKNIFFFYNLFGEVLKLSRDIILNKCDKN